VSKPHIVQAATRFQAHEQYIMAAVLAAFALGVEWKFHARSPRPIDLASGEIDPVLVVSGVIGFVALVFLGHALMNSLRLRKFGTSVLEIEEAVRGGHFRGVVRTARDLAPRGDYRLHLACIERLRKRPSSGNMNPRPRDVTRWESKVTVPAAGVQSRVGIPFDIPLPDVVPSDHAASERSEAIRWQLTVQASLPGLDYRAIFGVRIQGSAIE
jgi:hypothetical protein